VRLFPLASHDGLGRTVISAVAVFLAMAVANLPAQDFERYRPKTPVSEQGEAELPPLPKPAEGSRRVLVDELKGLVFVDHPDKVVVGRLDVSGIHVEGRGLWLLRSGALQRPVAPYLGGPITIRRLNEIAREVIIFYRQNDQPVVDVSVPEQHITDGVVQVVVTEARLGRIRVEGACFFDPCMLAEQVWTWPGDRIYESVLLEDLEWLNLNPFRERDLELTPGARFGQTDVVFNVHDHCPVLNRDSIVVYGGWAELESADAIPLGMEGKAWQADIAQIAIGYQGLRRCYNGRTVGFRRI